MIIAFVAACGSGSSRASEPQTSLKSSSYEWEDAAGNYYELIITEKRAVTSGNYVLTVILATGKELTSTGTASGTASSITLTGKDNSSVTIPISGTGELTVTSQGKNLEGTTISNSYGKIITTEDASSGEIIEAKAQTNFNYFSDWDVVSQKAVIKHLNNYMSAANVEVKGGNLNINLSIPKSRYMEKFNNKFPSGITISDSAAKMCVIDGLFTPNGEYALGCAKDEDNVAFLLYSDKAVTISGTDIYISEWDDYEGRKCSSKSTTIYKNFTVKKGWNYFIISDQTYEENETSTTISRVYSETFLASGTLPSGYNWYVVDVDYLR